MSPKNVFTVFISSTSQDLRIYREVAAHEIRKMGWHSEMMEDWGSDPTATVEACLEKLRSADGVLVLQAFRKGWVPSREQGGSGNDSVTALEVEFAKKNKMPVLVMLANDSWPNNLCEHVQSSYEWTTNF